MVGGCSLFTAIVSVILLHNEAGALSLNDNTLNRREWFQTSAKGLFFLPFLPTTATASEASSSSTPFLMKEYYQPGDTAPDAGRSFFPTLTPPFRNRATYRYSLGRDAWAFEQLLTFVNVTATIRTNVLLLKDGGLWIHSPQWPTGEFCALLEDLGHPVRHVVLPCNALEHKAPVQAFTKRFPDASVWISPGQYGPFGSCGMTMEEPSNMGYRVSGILAPGNPLPPWADEFDMATLYASLPENAGPVSEVAFCHRQSRTLIATDAVVYIPSGPAPDIFATYFDEATVKDDPTFWPRTALQAVFLPLRQDSSGKYPGYEALRERLVRAPILRAFADARAPDEVREWVQQVSTFKFDRILTSHFASPVAATPRDFQNAFGYLDDSLDGLPPVACQDWQLLDSLNQGIEQYKLGAPVVFDYQRGCIQAK